MATEQRLIDIEIKITRQEDLTQELSQLVYRQQKKLDELHALCAALLGRLGEIRGDDGEPLAHDRPPHY